MRRILQNNLLLSSQNVSAHPRHHYNPRRELEWAKSAGQLASGHVGKGWKQAMTRGPEGTRKRQKRQMLVASHRAPRARVGAAPRAALAFALFSPTANRHPPTPRELRSRGRDQRPAGPPPASPVSSLSTGQLARWPASPCLSSGQPANRSTVQPTSGFSTCSVMVPGPVAGRLPAFPLSTGQPAHWPANSCLSPGQPAN